MSVSSHTLSFEDYIQCRLFALTTVAFYNGRLFAEVLDILHSVGVSAFRWLRGIHDARGRFPARLAAIYAKFEEDTRAELHATREGLEAFLCSRENMARFVSGELGFNVLYNNLARCLVEAMEEVNRAAFGTAVEMVAAAAPQAGQKRQAYFSQLERFSLLRKGRLFDFDYGPEEVFDFKEILESGQWRPRVANGRRFRHRFFHDREQADMAREQMRVFGSDPVGLARVLTRIPVHAMYRRVAVEAEG